MANGDDSFEQESTTVHPPRETPTVSHPPRETVLQSLLNSLRSTSLTHQETATCLRSLTNVMTSSKDEDEALFQEVISKLNGSELQRMASLLTSNSDHYFLKISRNKKGSNRVRTLFGKSDDADTFFVTSILHHFFHVMTDKEAYDTYGSYVVQHVLKQDNLHCTYNIAVSLRGHYVELSFTRKGRYVVERLLEREETRVLVVAEILECGSDTLVRLATSMYGHFVVETALKLTRGYLFWSLVNKLKPFLSLLRRSNRSTTIAVILESLR
ncbi:hypothetical protein N665_0198s0124 [Sinapis alba]|nr:hypothetical protein N665_0198s0124 [Sinapis alba]